MTSQTPMAEELTCIEGLVARARSEVEAGAAVDLSELDALIGQLCGRITDLPGAEGGALKARLLALYDELGALAEVIRRTVETLEAALGENAKRREAASAYGQAPRSGT